MKRSLVLTVLLGCASTVRAATPVSILCFGDSITYADTGGNDAGYLGPLALYLAQSGQIGNMTNAGRPGEAVYQEGLTRLRSLLCGGYFYVLILEGTNDLLRWNPGPPSADDSANDLRAMITAVQSCGATPIIATVPPLWGHPGDPDNVRSAEWNRRIHDIGATMGVTVAEVNEAIKPYVGEFTYKDSLHPTPLGHTFVAEAFAAAITGQPLSNVDLAPPIPTSISPEPYSSRAPLGTDVEISVVEDKHPFDAATAVLKIDGVAVTPQVSANRGDYNYRYSFPAPLAFGQTVDVEFTVSDASVPPNQLVLAYNFTASSGNGTDGDIDKSNRIDGRDLAILSGSFGAARRDPRYLFGADIDSSGFVDGIDLAILTGKFGGPP